MGGGPRGEVPAVVRKAGWARERCAVSRGAVGDDVVVVEIRRGVEFVGLRVDKLIQELVEDVRGGAAVAVAHSPGSSLGPKRGGQQGIKSCRLGRCGI